MRPSPAVIGSLAVVAVLWGVVVGAVATSKDDGPEPAAAPATTTTAPPTFAEPAVTSGPVLEPDPAPTGVTTTLGPATSPSTGAEAPPGASLALLLIADPAGHKREPDLDVGGSRSLAQAADDDGGDDARTTLVGLGFSGGWQRVWSVPGRPDEEVFVDLKRFADPASAQRWAQRVEGQQLDPTASRGARRLPDPSAPPGATVFGAEVAGVPTEVNLVVAVGRHVAFISVLVREGDPLPYDRVVGLGREQATKLSP